MLTRDRLGVSLVELLTALALAGLVAAAAVRAVLTATRAYGAQAERIERRSTLRTAAAIVALELAGLSSGDTAGGDIAELAPDAITYRAVRSVLFLCRPPLADGPRTVTLAVAEKPHYGIRPPDPARDSLLVWADADHRSQADDRWIGAGLSNVRQGRPCPGRGPGFLLQAAADPAAAILGLSTGAPVLALEWVRLSSYRDRSGDWWLGARRPGGGSVQPLLGPLAPDGLRFTFYDAAGLETADPGRVASVGFTLAAGTPSRPRAIDSVALRVALRNYRPQSPRRTPHEE